MARKHSIAIVLITCLALIAVLIGLLTTNWIEGCLSLIDLVRRWEQENSPAYSSLYDDVPDVDRQICVSSGVFRISLSILDYTLSKTANFSALEVFMQTTILLLGFGVFATTLGVIMLVAIVCASRNQKYDKKPSAHPFFKPGFVCLLLGSMSFGAGMLVYTIPQLDIIHNSSAHLLQLQKIFSKYDAGDELLDLNNNDNFNNIQNKDLKTSLIFFSDVDPVFGFSYYVTWLGFILSWSAWMLLCGRLFIERD